MQVVSATSALFPLARKRIDYLAAIVPQAFSFGDAESDRRVAFITVELLNCWGNFSRALYFSSCRGARDGAGRRVTTTAVLPTFVDAQTAAIWRFSPRLNGVVRPWTHKDEPNWNDPAILLNALNNVGASNHIDVAAALSFHTRVLTDLPTVRNFYAHRAQNTAEKVRKLGLNYGLPGIHHPAELCLGVAQGRTRSILADWVSEVRLLAELAVT